MNHVTKVLVCGLLAGLVAACGSTASNAGNGAAGSANTLETGACADSCPKPCGGDADCMTSNGELCCDYGDGDGKACVAAKDCPRQCDGDARCDTTKGETCGRVTLETATQVCTAPANALQLCKNDLECSTAGEVCCAAYDEPVCLPANRCPKTCSTSSECSTASGEICCATLSKVDTSLKAGGVCISPSVVPCPLACKQSSDCATNHGELCCDGFCSTTCAKECKTSSDCTGQICCKTRAAVSPLARGAALPGYTSVIRATIPDSCNGFKCADGTCLPLSSKCDSLSDCAGGEDELGCSVTNPMNPMNPTCSSSSLGTDGCPRIGYWQGVVNVHRDPGGMWISDSDCGSGAELDPLTYCQKFYPNTTSVTPVPVTPKPDNLWNAAACSRQVTGDGLEEYSCN